MINIDGTLQASTARFKLTGLTVVSWEHHPSDWATTAVNGVTGYWVRARISAFTSMSTNPAQQNRKIYSAAWNYIRTTSDQIAGDITALVRQRAQIMTLGGGASDSADWFMCGVRGEDRGTDFVSIINLCDEQNPSGITVTAPVGSDTAFGADITAPTGRSATFNPTGADAMDNRLIVEIDDTISSSFFGRFAAFLRCKQTGGSVGDTQVQIGVGNAAAGGGVDTAFVTNPPTHIETVGVIERLSLGVVNLPVGSVPVGETPTIRIYLQASAASGTPNLVFDDLILIPIDEVAVIADNPLSTDPVSSVRTEIDLDLIRNPKAPNTALLRAISGTNEPVIQYTYIGPAYAIRPGVTFRIWFLATDDAYPGYYATFQTAWAMRLYRQQRYLSMRGGR
jgi:hypothetical protein